MTQERNKRDLYTNGLKTKLFLICGTIAGPLFTFVWIITGAARANYNSLRHPISSLSIGEFGWTQVTNFIVTGLLMLVFAFGLWRVSKFRGVSTRGSLLFGAYAMGLLGAGFFTTDPMNGYPPGTPVIPLANKSAYGALHNGFSTLVFVGLPIACFVLARYFSKWGERGWSIYSKVTGIAFVFMFVITSAGFAQVEGLVDSAGLFQRITLTIGWVWITLLAIHLLKAPSETLRMR